MGIKWSVFFVFFFFFLPLIKVRNSRSGHLTFRPYLIPMFRNFAFCVFSEVRFFFFGGAFFFCRRVLFSRSGGRIFFVGGFCFRARGVVFFFAGRFLKIFKFSNFRSFWAVFGQNAKKRVF